MEKAQIGTRTLVNQVSGLFNRALTEGGCSAVSLRRQSQLSNNMKDNTDFPELQEKCATKVRQKYTSSPIEQDIHNKELSFPQQAHFGTEDAVPQPVCLR